MDKQNTSTQGGDANETDGAQADVASGHGPSQYTPNGPFHSTASGPNLPPTAPVSGHQVYLTLSEAVTGPDGRNSIAPSSNHTQNTNEGDQDGSADSEDSVSSSASTVDGNDTDDSSDYDSSSDDDDDDELPEVPSPLDWTSTDPARLQVVIAWQAAQRAADKKKTDKEIALLQRAYSISQDFGKDLIGRLADADFKKHVAEARAEQLQVVVSRQNQEITDLNRQLADANLDVEMAENDLAIAQGMGQEAEEAGLQLQQRASFEQIECDQQRNEIRQQQLLIHQQRDELARESRRVTQLAEHADRVRTTAVRRVRKLGDLLESRIKADGLTIGSLQEHFDKLVEQLDEKEHALMEEQDTRVEYHRQLVKSGVINEEFRNAQVGHAQRDNIGPSSPKRRRFD